MRTNDTLRVLFAASEMAPLAKVGGLGDVIGSLPEALTQLGLGTSVVLPYYEHVQPRSAPQHLLDLDIRGEDVAVFLTEFAHVKAFLLQSLRYLSRGPVYLPRTAFADFPDEFERFSFFSEAVAALLDHPEFPAPNILHANDWHTGSLVRLVAEKPFPSRPKLLFTIHNLEIHGGHDGKDPMAEGIEHADLVTTVSRTYADEITTPAFGDGLEGLLQKRAREKRLVGILNGVDYAQWPLETRNKVSFQKQLGLAVSDKPLFGMVARLTKQKGIDLAVEAAEEFVVQGRAQFVFLGQGQAELERRLTDLAMHHPMDVHGRIGFDETFARSIYGQSDFFLIPSRFEPCGLGQMISMHYGTPPIVRGTGGLQESVQDGKTGFVFKEASTKALAESMEKALAVYGQQQEMEALRRTCAAEDFSWTSSAKEYLRTYEELLKA